MEHCNLKSADVMDDICFELSVLESFMVESGVDSSILTSPEGSRWIEVESTPERTMEEIITSIIDLNADLRVLDKEEALFISSLNEIKDYQKRVISMLRTHKNEDDNLFPDVTGLLSPEELSEREQDIAKAMQVLRAKRMLFKLKQLIVKHFD